MSRPIVLENDCLRAVCYPEHGFTIGSILDKRHDVELLWHPAGSSYEPLTMDLGRQVRHQQISLTGRYWLAAGSLCFPIADQPAPMVSGGCTAKRHASRGKSFPLPKQRSFVQS